MDYEMNFYEDLFVPDLIKLSKEEMIATIRGGKTFLNTYILTLPLVPTEDQLEIYHIELNKQKYFNAEDFLVVGIAQGYQDAIELVEKITRIVYNETGNADIKAYFREKI